MLFSCQNPNHKYSCQILKLFNKYNYFADNPRKRKIANKWLHKSKQIMIISQVLIKAAFWHHEGKNNNCLTTINHKRFLITWVSLEYIQPPCIKFSSNLLVKILSFLYWGLSACKQFQQILFYNRFQRTKDNLKNRKSRISHYSSRSFVAKSWIFWEQWRN